MKTNFKILLFELWPKILLANQIAGFFKMKEGSNEICFWHSDKH